MKVKEFTEMLRDYDGEAEVIFVEWETGETFDVTVGSDDDDEGTKYCRLSAL